MFISQYFINFEVSLYIKMGNYKKQFGQKILTLVLFIALMLPIAVQFSHIFEEHEHVSCNESSIHVHELAAKCETCNFCLPYFNYNIVEYSELPLPIIHVKINDNFSSLQLHSFIITNTQLRAPPVFS